MYINKIRHAHWKIQLRKTHIVTPTHPLNSLWCRIKQRGRISKTDEPSYHYYIFADTRGKFSGTCVLRTPGLALFPALPHTPLHLSPSFLFPRHPASRKFPTIASSNLATRPLMDVSKLSYLLIRGLCLIIPELWDTFYLAGFTPR